MAYTNVHKFAGISPTKLRPVADLIRGKRIDEAQAILEMSKRRGAVLLLQSLQAARGNADQAEADVRRLYVSEVRVDVGPTRRKFQPKDRGRAFQIIKRTSHVTVALDEA